MAQGTLTVTAGETNVQLIDFPPSSDVTFELHYHYGDNAARFLSLSGYDTVDEAGALDLTIPLGSDFVQALTDQPFTFADGPFFTGNGVFLATRP